MSRLERKHSIFKKLAILVVFNMVFEIVAPTVSMALTSGPSSPEFGSFEPVATNNMVDPFTGDFTYNLPVLMVPGTNGGGYPISLSYHSGTTGEQEASWVGHGWSLNPGAINRGKQGFPDDWNGEKVVNHNKSIPNMTITGGASAATEIFSLDMASLNAGLTYNNYKGLGYTTGGGFSLAKGFISLGFNITDGQSAFSLRVDPWKLLSKDKEKFKAEMKSIKALKKLKSKSGFDGLLKKSLLKALRGSARSKQRKSGGVYGVISLSGGQKPNQINDYTGTAFNFSSGIASFPTVLPGGVEVSLQGSFALQRNKPKTENDAYGFYYNKQAYNNDNNLMDYYTEKAHPYENNDIFLGIPHALSDQYAVTGEGISGAFRMHNRSVGQFRPNKVNSELIIGNVGFSAGFGLNIDAGFDIGTGYHRFTQKEWELYAGQEEYSYGKENKIFRFANDLGGLVTFTDDEQNETAKLYKENGLPGFKKFSPDVSSIDQSINTSMDNNHSVGASSYIGHNTFEEHNLEAGSVKYNAYEKDPSISNFVDFSEEALKNQICEMSVKNKSGETYNYGLPVFARNERDISVGNKGVNATVENGYLAYGDIGINTQADRNKLRIIQGQERNSPYVTTYLLTSIYEPNYIDRTNNGPTEDDFGGYTKFSYKQAYGSTEEESKTNGGTWYNWRFPYTGMYYNRGRLSDKKDDMLSYNSGQKEMYYLENIETKTHIAVFHTSFRTDGCSAHHENDQADNDGDAKGGQKLQKLDKIELFVKDEAWEAYNADPILNPKPAPLKTVNFEYDYSLVPGIPNSLAEEGKLTLKRVWFDYDGIYEAKISPYEFEYNYPDYSTYPSKYRSGTDDVTAGYAEFNLVGPSAQNPAYHEQQLNAWGYNQGIEEGKNANDRMNPWLNQTLENGNDTNLDGYAYDPAAWNLKRIVLPSGGEIHVQYEQDDYAYVQDKQAHVMVPLLVSSDDDGNSPRYHLNTDAIGITTPQKRQELVDAINKWYVLGDEKIYFRFLYSVSELNLDPQISQCNSEYITGYINVKETGIEAGKVYIDLQADVTDNRFDLPKKVCKEYAKAFLSGKLVSGNCGLDGDLSYEDDDPENAILSFLNSLSDFNIPGTTNGCAHVNFQESYFRVPAVNPKKGGGLRVKRLMMYTPSLNPGEEPELYGTEYIYQFKDTDGKVKSSGVAVNEPSAIREENILISNIDRLPKNIWDKARDLVVAGKEKEKFEGPIGESLYGSSSVGYSQIITRNIHSGETNTGFTVQQFHTAKDFPLVSKFTDLAANTKKDYLPIPALWVNNLTNNVWATQGFHFTLNNMHGQPKRTALFTGNYSGILGPVSANLVSATEYEYFDVTDPLPVMNSLQEIEYVNLGKETEVYMESRSVTDHLHDVSAEFDGSVGFAVIPVPFVSLFPSYTHTETELHTHVTNKITRYPAVVKAVRNYTDGIWSKSENLAFNPQTGDPVITRTYDDFNRAAEEDQFQIDGNDHEGWLTAYGIPAYLEYANMNQVILNQGKTYGASAGIGYQINKVYYPGSGKTQLEFINTGGIVAPCDAVKSLATGDLIKLNTGDGEIYHISEISGSSITIVPTYFAAPITSSATAINFNVIRSGRTNQTATNVGDFVTYGRTGHPTGILPEITEIAISDPAHPDYGIYTSHSAFVSSLNAALSGGGGAVPVPPGMFLDLDDPTMCWNVDGYHAGVYSSGDEVQVSWAGSTDCIQNLTGVSGGAFHINPDNGAIYYGLASGGCNPQALECLVFCEQLYPIKSIDRVLSASAITIADKWDFDETIYNNGVTGYNDFELGKRGKWRLKSNYAYHASTTGLMARFNPFTSSTTDENFNYNSGLFKLNLFNWHYANANDPKKWLKATTITRYSPNGNAIEEQNILGIKSAVKFGYNENLPYLVAGNSPYESVLFESFENTYSTIGGLAVEEQLLLQTGTETTQSAHHTGYSSLKIEGGSANSFFVSPEMEFTSQIQTAGLHSKVWVKNVDHASEGVVVIMTDVTTGNAISGSMQKVVQVGEWTLYELNHSAWGAFNPAQFKISYSIENANALKDYYIDDLRIQPMDSELVGYVYDYKNFRLLATLDDQNFAMLYQYSEEGKLTRKLVETMRGIKTIADGYQNTPLKDRN